MQLGVTEKEWADWCKAFSRRYYGDKGAWACDVFDFINQTYFAGELPWPNIVWALTAHGRCLGLTSVDTATPPTIVLHPSLLGGTEKSNPWGIDAAWLGFCYAFDVLLHESMHVSVEYLLGGWKGKGSTSHNNDVWIAEANRLAPLLGITGMTAARSKSKRIADEGATPTKTGKAATRVIRTSEGSVPFKAVATFPGGVRLSLGTAKAYYQAGRSPFDEHVQQQAG